MLAFIAGMAVSIVAEFIPNNDPQKPFLDYVARDEPHFGWEDTGIHISPTLFGGQIWKLNVTSL